MPDMLRVELVIGTTGVGGEAALGEMPASVSGRYCYVGIGSCRALLPAMRLFEVQIRHHVRGGHGEVSHIQVEHGVDGGKQMVFIHGVAPSFGKVKDGSQNHQQADERSERNVVQRSQADDGDQAFGVGETVQNDENHKSGDDCGHLPPGVAMAASLAERFFFGGSSVTSVATAKSTPAAIKAVTEFLSACMSPSR